MLVLLGSLALWPLAAMAADRDPLPALAVERPLALPRGWLQLELGTLDQEHSRLWTGRLRYGALRGLELFWEGGVAQQQGLWGPSEPGFGARWQLFRREPPNTAAALELSWRVLAAGVPELGIVGQLQRQVGPLLGKIELGPKLRDEQALYGGVGMIVQLGPLAPGGRLQAELYRDSRWMRGTTELLVQVSRGFGLRGALFWPLLGEDPSRSALSLEIAL
jgi:hypothetical protein